MTLDRDRMVSDAVKWIQIAIQRHGGGERWGRLRLTISPKALTGVLPWAKGIGRTFMLPSRIEIQPSCARAVFFDFPREGSTGVFEAGRVALGDSPLAERRATFCGLRKWRRWSPLDALYFFGYALTHYHAVPFTLLDAELLRWNSWRRSLTVAFPSSVHTHSSVQTFYFDESGLIVRHDYVAEIVGFWARGAHMWGDYVTVDGIPIATHRRVYARLGRVPVPVVALDGRFEEPSATVI